MSKSSVLLFQRITPSYRVPVFRRLHEELQVVLCYSDATVNGVASHLHGIEFQNELLPGGFFLGRSNLFSQKILSVLRKHRPSVVICEYAFGNFTFWKLLLLRPFMGYRLIGWSHGIKNRDMVLDEKSMHFKTTGFFLKRLDAVLLYSEQRRQRLVERMPSLAEKTFVAHNTLDTTLHTEVYQRYQERNRDALKRELGISTRFTLCFLGRLRDSKRIDLILEIWEKLRASHDIGLVLIGDGPERQRLEKYREEPGLFAPGAIHDVEESGKYLAACDAMIMPGYVGLSIVHAFAFGLPMITCRSTKKGPFHSPEIEYLKDGVNGFFCDSDADTLAGCVERLILDSDLLTKMKQNALDTVQNEANVDRMITGFSDAIEYVTGQGKSTS